MHDEAMARSVLAALRLEHAGLEPIGLGLASDAWLVRDEAGWFVLRVATDVADPPTTYAMEHAVMARLTEACASVPSPIVGDWDVAGWTGPPFSLTTHVAGVPLQPTAHERAIVPIAAFLRAMHAIRVDGVGAMVVIDGELRGEATDLGAGILAWAERGFWPLGDTRLETHPGLANRPALVARLAAHEPMIRAALLRGPVVPLHGDLHDENILNADGAISVIDFGETLVGPMAWEFASLGYFLDWPFADGTLAAYLDDPGELDGRRADATAVALAFGVYRWHQDRELGLVDEDIHNEAFLEASLARVASSTLGA